MKTPPALENLLSLLDDDDEKIAIAAMAELLKREDELGEALAVLQDSSDPLTRKRSHQLQSALTLRRRRREFAARFNGNDFELAPALIETHLLWFDNDSQVFLEQLWNEMAGRACMFPMSSLQEVAHFMLKMHFSGRRETTLHPEYYCIGPVMENRTGSGSILCALICALLKDSRYRVIQTAGEFAVDDPQQGMRLYPVRNFRVAAETGKVKTLTRAELIGYIAMTLFSNAVNSDSFRYILTIAQSVTGEDGADPLRNLPYPYHPADEENSQSEEQGEDKNE